MLLLHLVNVWQNDILGRLEAGGTFSNPVPFTNTLRSYSLGLLVYFGLFNWIMTEDAPVYARYQVMHIYQMRKQNQTAIYPISSVKALVCTPKLRLTKSMTV